MASLVKQRGRMLAVTLLLSIAVGLSLGAFGGGGSTLTVPVLSYVARQPAASAVATSLFVVCATSIAAAVSYARHGRIRWSVTLMFGPAGMAGAFAGGLLSAFVPPHATLILFSITMCVTALAMLWRSRMPVLGDGELAAGRTVAAGVAVGLVTGVVGTGGGFLVVPALVLIARLPIEAAVGTSLVVIAMQSAAGLAGRIGHVAIDWQLAIAVAAVAVLGALLGGHIGRRIAAVRLQRGFSLFVLVTGLAMLAVELA
jgi:uncharacterized membrane protein YfcA